MSGVWLAKTRTTGARVFDAAQPTSSVSSKSGIEEARYMVVRPI
jgi:hypothetical protein